MNIFLFALGKPLLSLLGAASFTFLARNEMQVAPPEIQVEEARPVPRVAERGAPIPRVEELPQPEAPDDDEQE